MAGSILLLRCLLVAGLASPALAVDRAQTPAKPSSMAKIQEDPLLIYLAKSEPGACGEGCSEWIAAEGSFDKGSAERLRVFLKRIKNSKLPVYFNSPGGFEGEGIKIGRILRQRGMTAGVARTVPVACRASNDAACREARHSAQPVAARWVSLNADCNSSCVYALIGAKVRDVPAGARIGVHASKLVEMTYGGRAIDLTSDKLPAAVRMKIASLRNVPREYVREMGIDAGLTEVITRTPNERMQVLTRAEITRFGIDKRLRHETGWMLMEGKSDPTLVKLAVNLSDGHEPATAISVFRIICRPGGQIAADFYRSMWPDDRAASATARFVVGGRTTEFARNGGTMKGDSIEPGTELFRHFTTTHARFFDEAATQDSLEIVETVKAADKAVERGVTLSTAGLTAGLSGLRGVCRDIERPSPEEIAARAL